MLIALSLLVSVVAGASTAGVADFKATFNKTYADGNEEAMRAATFASNLEHIQKLNALERAAQPDLTGDVYGTTEFTDLTSEEFAARIGLRVLSKEPAALPQKPVTARPKAPPHLSHKLPSDALQHGSGTLHDWCLGSKFCTAIKSQGRCGDCWAFAAVEMMESMALISGLATPELSPQQLADCLQQPGVCEPHPREEAWEYARHHPIETAASYPITSQATGVTSACHASRAAGVLRASKVTRVRHDEQSMVDWVGRHGPLAISVNIKNWQFYTGGRDIHGSSSRAAAAATASRCNYISAATCGDQVDHAVQLVGFVVSDKKHIEGWRVRNSWGDAWGCDGFAYLTAGEDTCRITTDPASVSVEAATAELFV